MKIRYESRRAVSLAMEIITSHWDEPVSLQATDLSPRGAYVPSPLVPEAGEHVVCSFHLNNGRHYDFFARVVRVDMGRRKADIREPGFGLSFLDARPLERLQIREALDRVPPPVPSMRTPKNRTRGKRKLADSQPKR